ncbi:MAG: fimbrillin family protein [Parabacteroides gordonii]|uniref:fimbrillin family protein n=1 Tax=Parabacteroides gordonii TaxID=574930 RepID=UPI003A83AC92
MKNKLKYMLLFPLLAFIACSGDNDELPDDGNNSTLPAALRIEVSASDFTNDNGTNTRATDNGAVTTFESGDRIGIIVLDGSGNVLSDNIPYKYNGSAWSFDNANGEGKTALYYDNKATAYVAYFPYSPEADGITGADIPAALEARFPPRYDQRTKDAYRASDLLVWSNSMGSVPLMTLEIEFTHAYSSLSLSPSVICKIDGKETSYIPSSVADVSFTIGTEPLLPYRADDGSFRIIVSPQQTSARWLCAYGGTMHSGTMQSTALAANNRYTLAPALNIGAYALGKAQVGDFYCKNSSNEGYLIPGDATPFPGDMNCIGIVFKAGREASDKGSYTDIGSNEMPVINGYVVALQDVSSSTLKWADKNGLYEFWVGTSADESDWQGYDNCQKMKKGSDWSIGHFPAANACQNFGSAEPYLRYAAPAGSSGWFLPSCGQLLSLYKNRDVLSGQINKLKAINGYGSIGWFRGDYYWSSSEVPGYSKYTRYVSFGNGRMDGDYKYDGNYVRGVFAF